ncbi:hypothetical protein SSPO_007270 [Streptomyces antimycoticus]|uniref:HTH luxR-type domain-containing protein n=1 Tax=Streptomyces antimycoticus TaxID=68175 RepID=A0A499ULJ9_9ACTN|nr:hypothetical protein SSPO_007270 [Streptomyces antimycoticus]
MSDRHPPQLRLMELGHRPAPQFYLPPSPGGACAGAAGFLAKHTAPEDIVAAVRRAARGEPALSPSAARALIEHAAAGPDDRAEPARQRLALLTEREREVAEAVAEGLSNTDIGTRLHLSLGTVKAHLSSALAKLDLDNRVQLALLTHDAHPRS